MPGCVAGSSGPTAGSLPNPAVPACVSASSRQSIGVELGTGKPTIPASLQEKMKPVVLAGKRRETEENFRDRDHQEDAAKHRQPNAVAFDEAERAVESE